MEHIQFYLDGNRVVSSDDPQNPAGITFEGIQPIDTSELTAYLAAYETESARLSTLRHSNDEAVADDARKQQMKLNWQRNQRLDTFAQKIQRSLKWNTPNY